LARRPRIAVVGAGPAGSTFALRLVRAGVDPDDLVLIDKARFPRPKLCGGGITFRGTELFAELFGRPPGGVTTVGLEFRCALGRFDVRERGPQWVYDRSALDASMLDTVRALGVEVREACTVTAVEARNDRWDVVTANGRERFEWVIGADGANGITRRASGLAGGIVGRLVEATYERGSAEAARELLYFDFDPILERIPGYAWVFPSPEGDDLFKIGVMDGRGRVGGDVLRAYTDRYAAKLGFRKTHEKIAGWPERYWDLDTRAHRPGLLLVGEAFGIDALLGEGIAPSMFSAVYAADRLKRALDRSEDTIPLYEAGFALSAEGRNLWFQARLADRLYGAHPFRWLRVLFEMEHLHALAGAGGDAYGRLLKHMPALVARYAAQVASTGIPSAKPISLDDASALPSEFARVPPS
jgi:flavin-dependent dehydrogenase